MPKHVPTRSTLLAVDHSFLHVATLSHVAEHPLLAAVLERLVEQSLATRRPFPNTMLTGGPDSSKRVIAHAIAADLAVPLVQVDLSALRSPNELHEQLLAVEAGSIVLATAPEHGLHGPLPDLISAALSGRCVLRNVPGARYERFTVILCTRERMPAVLGGRDSFAHRFYVNRTMETEAIRLRRVLARAGATCDADAARSLAMGVVRMRLPTVGAAAAVAALLDRRGSRHLDDAQINDDCWKTLMTLADPRWLRTLAKRDRAAAVAAAADPAAPRVKAPDAGTEGASATGPTDAAKAA